MNTYQLDTLISESGIIKLPEMPYLFNKKVKLIIISQEDKPTETEQRKLAFERLLNLREIIPKTHLSDEERDNIRYERLKEKHL